MATASFKVAGVEPPDYDSRPDLHPEFWQAVVNITLVVKDAELAKGIDVKGKPLARLAPATIAHRHSAMGPADPKAPPLVPAHGLSRTRSLFTGEAFPAQGYALFSWKADPITGNPWGDVLAIHRKGGPHLPKRNVIGLSPAGLDEVRAKSWAWWARRKLGPVAPPAVQLQVLPTPAPKFLVTNVPKYQPKVPAGAIPAKNKRVSQIGINGHIYTLQGGGAAQIKRSIANGSFSGFGKAAEFDLGPAPTPPPKAPPEAPQEPKAKPKPGMGAGTSGLGVGGKAKGPKSAAPSISKPPSPKSQPPPKAPPRVEPPLAFEEGPAVLAAVGPARPPRPAPTPTPTPRPAPPSVVPPRPKAPPEAPQEPKAKPKAKPVGGKAKGPKSAAPSPPQPPTPSPQPPPETFPTDPLALKVVKKLGGSTGAELVEDAAGRRFVRKTGSNPDHIREEAHADAAYRALGVRVPAFKLYETPKGPVKLAEFVAGRTLADVAKSDPALARRAEADLRGHFAVDALLGNWDVLGMDADNVLVDAHGNAWRIDNGGALRFRAQGERKTADQWDAYPTELWTMRQGTLGGAAAQARKVFGPLGMREIAGQVDALDGAKLAGVLPDEVAVMVGKRLGQLKDTSRIAKTLMEDRFKDSYADGFTKHTIGIRKAGIADRMPRELKRQGGGVTVHDEAGEAFDHLRGPDSLVVDLKKYIEQQGGTYDTIRHWMSSQAGSSWSAQAKALKRFLADRRDVPLASYYWQATPESCGKELEKVEQLAGGKAPYEAAIQALHAFTREYLERARFEGKDPAAGTVRLMRTEDKAVMDLHHMKKGDRKVMTRGVAESFSIYRKVTVHGSETTVQDVPLHRVIGTYWQERSPGQGGSAFLGDHENEFVCLAEGLVADYKKK